MQDMLIYYGWLNSYNSATNNWSNEACSQDFSRYSILCFGDGLQTPTHGDYSNTEIIIPRIMTLNPNAKIFGYVTLNQSFSNFKDKVDDWDDLDVHGIFIDEAGYDYGSSSTNGRAAFNDKMDYIHSQVSSNIAMINAWKLEHIWGTNSDASYPDSTWNPDGVDPNINEDDWYLFESLAIDSNEAYETHTQWRDRVRGTFPGSCAAVSIIGDGKSDGQDRFDFIYTSAHMKNLDAVGSSDVGYGATNSKSKMWDRPAMLKGVSPGHIADGVKYYSYMEDGRYILDFTASSEDVTIDKY